MKPPAFRQFLKVEGSALIIITPFLTFPSLFLPGTILSLLIVAWIWTRNWRGSVQLLPPTPINGALLFWAGSIIIGMVVSTTPDLTIPKATGLILGLTLWRFVVITIQDYQELTFIILMFMLMGLGILVAGFSVIRWYAKIPLFGYLLFMFPSQFFHLPGNPDFGISPNQLAGTIQFFLPLVIIFLVSGWYRREKRILTLIAIPTGFLSIYLLIFSQSRSGWFGGLAILISIPILYFFSSSFFKSRQISFKKLLPVIPVFLLFWGILFYFSPNMQKIMSTPIEEFPPAASYNILFRQEAWRIGIRAAGEFPVTGVGLGSFRDAFSNSYVSRLDPEVDVAHAHNIFLQVALDTGIPGLIAYLAILFSSFSLGWEVIQENEKLKPLAVSLLAGLIGLHVYGLTDTIAVGSKTHFVYWVVIGLLVGMHQLCKLEQA